MNRRRRCAVALLAATTLLTSPGLAADCVLDGNPGCGAATSLGQVAGDTGTPTITHTGAGEAFFTVRLGEEASATRDLSVAVRLQVPAGMAYDLRVRCTSCSSVPLRSSPAGPGETQEVRVVRRDRFADSSFSLVIEVRFRAGSSCAPWTLTVVGNAGPGATPLTCG